MVSGLLQSKLLKADLHQPEWMKHFPGDSVQFNKDLVSFWTLFVMENTKEVQQLKAWSQPLRKFWSGQEDKI